jgi:hypothetical protein
MPGQEGAQQVDVGDAERHEDGGQGSEQAADLGVGALRNLGVNVMNFVKKFAI